MEGPAQGLGGPEPAAAGDHVDPVVSVEQRALGRLDPRPLDPGGRRDAQLGGEAALQVAGAESGVAGQLGDAVASAGVGVRTRRSS